LLVAENLVEGTSGFGFERSGVMILRHTLELPRNVLALEDNIPAAAVWILTAGEWFYEHRGLRMETPGLPFEQGLGEFDDEDELR
jgi:hypothetical protein